MLGQVEAHAGPAREVAAVVAGVGEEACAGLLDVRHAGGAAGLFARGGESGQEHRGEDGDDGHDDQQLDERERH